MTTKEYTYTDFINSLKKDLKSLDDSHRVFYIDKIEQLMPQFRFIGMSNVKPLFKPVDNGLLTHEQKLFLGALHCRLKFNKNTICEPSRLTIRDMLIEP